MKRIQINYKPLDKSVTLSPVGGSTVQQYNATIGEYVPDRWLVPLVINPIVFIADPDGKIASGIKNSELTDINWYENKVEAGTLIAASNASYVIDRDSTDNNKGRIAVMKNVESSLTLIFTARYLDTRTNQGVPIQGSILLRSEEVVDVAPIRLLPTYPFGKRLYVLTGQTGLKISCPLMNGQEKVSGAVYKWYMKTDGDYSLVAEGNSGITGATGSELWIPVDAMKKRTTFKTEVTCDGNTYTEEHILTLVYGDCNVEVIVPGDGDISPTATSVTVKAEVSTPSGVLASPENYYDFDWYDQTGKKLGSGVTLSITASKFSAADFAVEVRATEKRGAKVWVADFKTYNSATLSGKFGAVPTAMLPSQPVTVDLITDSNGNAFLMVLYTSNSALQWMISDSVIAVIRYDKGEDSSKLWGAYCNLKAGRHSVYIKCNTIDKKPEGLTVKVDGIEIADKYFDSFYPGEIDKEVGTIMMMGGGRPVSLTWGTYCSLNFQDQNTLIKSSSESTFATLVPEGATLDQLIKQI